MGQFVDRNREWSRGGTPARSAPLGGKPLQRKLTGDSSQDPLEREAEQVADRTAMSSSPAVAGATPPRIQRHAAQPAAESARVPASVERVLGEPGATLDAALQDDMGQRFGHDFSRVRVHSGGAAAESARDVGADAFTVGHDIVFGSQQFAPATHRGRRLLAHELTHVVQQADAGPGRSGPLQRQAAADVDDRPMRDFMRIYSFGPTGAGRMTTLTGRSVVFPPAAPVDVKGRELVRAGTASEPKLARFGRYFTLDYRHRPYPSAVPACGVKAIVEWHSDDRSQSSKDVAEDPATRYYRPGEPLGTNLGTEYIFRNDRPGVLVLAYVFTNPDSGLVILGHEVHFVDDPAAPTGATVLPQAQGQGAGASAPQSGKAAPVAPSRPADAGPEKGPDATGRSQPAPPATQAPPAEPGRISALTELIKKTSDAVKRDPLVSQLRDLLARLQPLIPAKDAKKMIDDAINSLVKDGADAGILAILKAVTGRSPTTMPENRNQTGPDVPQRDLGEQIFQGPKIPINDAPAPVPSSQFRYSKGPQASYEPGAMITFDISPPANIDSVVGMRVVIVKEADRDTPNATLGTSVALHSTGTQPIVIRAPDTPGKYVIRVDTGMDFDRVSRRSFEVVAPQKK